MPILPRKTLRTWGPVSRRTLQYAILGLIGWGMFFEGIRLPWAVPLWARLGLEALALWRFYKGYKVWRAAISSSATVLARFRIPVFQHLFAQAFALQSLVLILPTAS